MWGFSTREREFIDHRKFVDISFLKGRSHARKYTDTGSV